MNADQAMCRNQQCPNHRECLRYKSVPAEQQTYCTFAPEKDAEQCDFFLEIGDTDWKAISAHKWAVLQKEEPEFARVLMQMCKYAKVDADEVEWARPDWMSRVLFTKQASAKFKAWLNRQFRTRALTRKSLMVMPSNKTKRHIDSVVAMFMLMYGFEEEAQ